MSVSRVDPLVQGRGEGVMHKFHNCGSGVVSPNDYSIGVGECLQYYIGGVQQMIAVYHDSGGSA